MTAVEKERAFARFKLVNDDREDVLIRGSDDRCDGDMCIALDEECPFVLRARSSREISVRIAARKPGTFERTLALYTDSPAQPEIRLRASISAAPAEARSR